MSQNLQGRMAAKKKVLLVGLLCVDVIAECDDFPREDTDQRCKEIRKQKGGNAANSSFILAQLGQDVDLLTNIGTGDEVDFVLSEMKGVNLEHCPRVDAPLPKSVVIINGRSGSRTILHSGQGLPELILEDFRQLNLSEYSWIHFEGRSRNVHTICEMVSHIREYNLNHKDTVTISIEIEKCRNEIIELFDKADVLFVSKDHVKFHGYTSPEEGLADLSLRCRPDVVMICAWGERGAWARKPNGEIIKSPAYPPQQVVDTLGAGDTFNAVMICSLVRQWPLQQCLDMACRISGAKVGQKGYDGLKDLFVEDLAVGML